MSANNPLVRLHLVRLIAPAALAALRRFSSPVPM